MTVDVLLVAAEGPNVKKPATRALPPTQAKVAYGEHKRLVLDFYQAKSGKPTPLLFFIHGASGVSAGACSSLWLAFHDDMADEKSKDPTHTANCGVKLQEECKSIGV